MHGSYVYYICTPLPCVLVCAFVHGRVMFAHSGDQPKNVRLIKAGTINHVSAADHKQTKTIELQLLETSPLFFLG